MNHHILELLHDSLVHYGYWAVAVLLLLENAGLPLPGESILLLASFLAYSEHAPSLAQLAAAYAKGIVANHPFVDGNKRTGFIVSVTFLRLIGIELTAPKEDRVLTFWKLAAGDLTEEELALWFAEHTTPL